MNLTELFCEIDDFCHDFEPKFNEKLITSSVQTIRNTPASRLCLSEILTIIIYFHQSAHRTFKNYYLTKIFQYHQNDFPNLVSYSRFVELMPSSLIPLTYYLNSRKGKKTGLSFIDSTRLPICHPKRAKRNKVFQGLAAWGNSSIGWFFGFKLHLIINEHGDILALKITPGNVDDRIPVPELTKNLWGWLFGDKGYIKQKLWSELWSKNLKLITPLKRNMKNKLIESWEKIMLRKRAIIETVNDQLKNISQISHSRHRSIINFLVNVVAGLIAYTFQAKKPSLKLEKSGLMHLSSLSV
ncbi:MAG TPA: IS982 family transposase [Cyanobacteria bacterium UBA11367]|nr:IS982 family transposase [Cyanobacteria bacterium UBA11367]HBS68910.1 IS982 family transposase [Cyanobacteria bacterium UBA11153]